MAGAAAAWCDIHQHFGGGKLSLKAILQPAIDLARKGFPVGPQAAAEWIGSEKFLASASPSGGDLLIDGKAPRAGQIFSNPNLAKTFETLAEEGRDGFYKGRIAEAIVDGGSSFSWSMSSSSY